MSHILPPPPLTVTADHTVVAADRWILVDATGGDVTVTLPDADERAGREVLVKRIDSSGNTVDIVAQAGDAIEDEPIQLVLVGEVYALVSDGATKWWIL